MESRGVIIAMVVVLLLAAVIVGVWWWITNEDQLGLTAVTSAVSAITVGYVVR